VPPLLLLDVAVVLVPDAAAVFGKVSGATPEAGVPVESEQAQTISAVTTVDRRSCIPGFCIHQEPCFQRLFRNERLQANQGAKYSKPR
jgi:hypothetical protein